jgi:hypothetical protein
MKRIALEIPGVAIDDCVPVEFRILRQKPPDMCPEESAHWTVRIVVVVGKVMVPTVHRDPECRCFLSAATAQNRDGALEPTRASEAPVGEQPMVADAQAHGPKKKDSDHAQRDAGPAEEPRNKGQERDQMYEKEEQRISPIHRRQRQWHPLFLSQTQFNAVGENPK